MMRYFCKFATFSVLVLLTVTNSEGSLDVQKVKFEDLYNDSLVVTNVAGSSTETNVVRELARDVVREEAYTKDQSDTILALKQNVLTPGSGILISNDVISASIDAAVVPPSPDAPDGAAAEAKLTRSLENLDVIGEKLSSFFYADYELVADGLNPHWVGAGYLVEWRGADKGWYFENAVGEPFENTSAGEEDLSITFGGVYTLERSSVREPDHSVIFKLTRTCESGVVAKICANGVLTAAAESDIPGLAGKQQKITSSGILKGESEGVVISATPSSTGGETADYRDPKDNTCHKTEFTEWVCTPSDDGEGNTFSIHFITEEEHGSWYSLDALPAAQEIEIIRSENDDKLMLEFASCIATRQRVAAKGETFVTQSFVTNRISTSIAASEKEGTDQQIVRGPLVEGSTWLINIAGLAGEAQAVNWNGVYEKPEWFTDGGLTQAYVNDDPSVDLWKRFKVNKLGTESGTEDLPAYLASGTWNTAEDRFAKMSDVHGTYVPSASDPVFSNAVLAVGLDTNTVAQIGELKEFFDGLPVGTVGTSLGGIILAILSAVAWLKKNKRGMTNFDVIAKTISSFVWTTENEDMKLYLPTVAPTFSDGRWHVPNGEFTEFNSPEGTGDETEVKFLESIPDAGWNNVEIRVSLTWKEENDGKLVRTSANSGVAKLGEDGVLTAATAEDIPGLDKKRGLTDLDVYKESEVLSFRFESENADLQAGLAGATARYDGDGVWRPVGVPERWDPITPSFAPEDADVLPGFEFVDNEYDYVVSATAYVTRATEVVPAGDSLAKSGEVDAKRDKLDLRVFEESGRWEITGDGLPEGLTVERYADYHPEYPQEGFAPVLNGETVGMAKGDDSSTQLSWESWEWQWGTPFTATLVKSVEPTGERLAHASDTSGLAKLGQDGKLTAASKSSVDEENADYRDPLDNTCHKTVSVAGEWSKVTKDGDVWSVHRQDTENRSEWILLCNGSYYAAHAPKDVGDDTATSLTWVAGSDWDKDYDITFTRTFTTVASKGHTFVTDDVMKANGGHMTDLGDGRYEYVGALEDASTRTYPREEA